MRYVTGFDRGVRPIGAWSTSTASVMNSTPSSFLKAPIRFSEPPFARLIAAYSTSWTSVDFPDPLTPVTVVNTPSGIVMSMFFRLLARAPRMTMSPLSAGRRLFGTGIDRAPVRYAPVRDSVVSINSDGVP